jgi:methyl-accepting chemotaxis protein
LSTEKGKQALFENAMSSARDDVGRHRSEISRLQTKIRNMKISAASTGWIPFSIENIAPSIENIASSIENIVLTIENITPSIENIAHSIENIVPTIENIAHSIENIAPSIEAIAIAVDEGNISQEQDYLCHAESRVQDLSSKDRSVKVADLKRRVDAIKAALGVKWYVYIIHTLFILYVSCWMPFKLLLINSFSD